MLLLHDVPPGIPTELDGIHNYYEGMVFAAIQMKLPTKYGSTAYIADIACVALNELPSRYIRHEVDMSFYLTSQERQLMSDNVERAVSKAIAYIDNNNQQYD
ncbi:MAG: late competence development ComFB family protein [Oceanicoccus sp.]